MTLYGPRDETHNRLAGPRCRPAFAAPDARAAIILNLSDGGGTTVNYAFSGGPETYTGGPAIGVGTSTARLPDAGTGGWSNYDSGSYNTNGVFKSDLGDIAMNAGSTLTMLFNASRIPHNSASVPSGSELGIDVDSDGGFSFEDTITGFWNYPGIMNGNTFQITGSGSFDLPSGTFLSNLNPGTYGGAPSGGIDFTVIVSAAPIPEPSSAITGALILGLGGLGLMMRRRRQYQAES